MRGLVGSDSAGDPTGGSAGSDQIDGGVVRGVVPAGAGGGGGVSEGATVDGVTARGVAGVGATGATTSDGTEGAVVVLGIVVPPHCFDGDVGDWPETIDWPEVYGA